jgi:hypothetical protein
VPDGGRGAMSAELPAGDAVAVGRYAIRKIFTAKDPERSVS